MKIEGGFLSAGLAALVLAVACTSEGGVENGTSGAVGVGSGVGGSQGSADAGAAGSGSTSNNGSAGVSNAGSSAGGAYPGGTGGSNTAGASGTVEPQGGSGGSSVSGTGGTTDQGGAAQGGAGGAGGSDVGQGGSSAGSSGDGQGGTGGSSVGAGGSDQGGAGGTDDESVPECDYQGGECFGLLYKECDVGEYFEHHCEFNCDANRGGCYGDCVDGDVRCADGAAQTCVVGEWTVTEQCAFQCVNAACEGVCTPGTVTCDGLSTVTCGSDFLYGSPVACPTDPNGTTSCSGGECDLQPIACSAGTADCDGNWSCEADLTSTATCGSCDTACPTRANATATCTGTCAFTCNPGFEDCDGDPSNGCELDTRADSLNCGACGNSCYGGSCTTSECQYDFGVVSDFTGESFMSKVNALTLSATHVYWLTNNELRRASKSGGTYDTLTTTTLPTGSPGATTGALVVEAGKVAWPTIDGLYVIPEAGGTVTKIHATRVMGVTGAAGKLYWNDSQFASGNSCRDSNFSNESAFRACSGAKTTTFYTRDLTTDAVTTWQLTGSEHSAPLAVIGNEMFVAEYQPIFVNSHSEYNIRIVARTLSSGAFVRIVADEVALPSDQNRIYQMRSSLGAAAFTPDVMLYSSSLGRSGNSSHGIVTGPTVSTDQPRQTNTPLASVYTVALATDGSAAFYSDNSGVYSVSLEGGAPHPFFDNATDATLHVAVDDTHIYFNAYATNWEQAILRAPK